MRENETVAAEVFTARTHLDPGTGEAPAVNAQLDGLRARWNQFGVATLIAAQDARPSGVVVRYRLAVDRHPDPQAVHAAFRGDLDQALARLAAPPAPISWDLAAMARAVAAVDDDADSEARPSYAYVDDADYDWNG